MRITRDKYISKTTTTTSIVCIQSVSRKSILLHLLQSNVCDEWNGRNEQKNGQRTIKSSIDRIDESNMAQTHTNATTPTVQQMKKKEVAFAIRDIKCIA